MYERYQPDILCELFRCKSNICYVAVLATFADYFGPVVAAADFVGRRVLFGVALRQAGVGLGFSNDLVAGSIL